MVKTLNFYHRDCEFNPRSGNEDPACQVVQPPQKSIHTGGCKVKTSVIKTLGLTQLKEEDRKKQLNNPLKESKKG